MIEPHRFVEGFVNRRGSVTRRESVDDNLEYRSHDVTLLVDRWLRLRTQNGGRYAGYEANNE